MNDFRPFSEYRQKDYVTPRSLKDIYGYEPELYVEKDVRGDSWVGWLAIMVAGFLIGLFVFGGK